MMLAYAYETTDATKPVRRFEVNQSIHDEPLHVDPETGEAVRRVTSGGYGVVIRSGSTSPCSARAAQPIVAGSEV
jgi:predicted nucleic acid-binding Zn ribbon protein